ncbi:hypothetical protein [Streptomyces caniscabiei]|uniref:Integral membrane protein n=1 Tax=Streptomyces caniscabiei TaxID=2746961 RepID=A0ABU4N2H2_9ACTN|nr:hypothetical protein [Streptomyces caniscabiei]MBE4740503.1 hypothetical protein [Streptomyces caniscabiei]MBE4761314.1 hypothetical protein [Streptomyces caniscabiei]MBE4773465.1 hypothetical protein [Streptomyces caniscabiei]MBE4790088.1 hypothetical protein [Streptomyces caniscabiei]MBE4799324.1 hypothetical protein [Streptomyces caniscabiei]
MGQRMVEATELAKIGAGLFGLVVGWIAYRTLRRKDGPAQVSDLASVIAAVGGGAVAALPFEDPDMFGAYAVGLGVGFFAYLLIGFAVEGKGETKSWMD